MSLIDDLIDFAIDNEISNDDWCDAVLQIYAAQSLMALEESGEDSWEENVMLGGDVVTIMSTVKKIQ